MLKGKRTRKVDVEPEKNELARKEETKTSKKPQRKRKKETFRNIRQQIEFYFSQANLTKDKYMMNLLHDNSTNWLCLEEFLKFKRVRALTSSVCDIRKALSESDVLELSPDNACVRRKTPIVPKENLDDCVIYVWGNVEYILLPKLDKDKQLPVGFGFVEFETRKMAEATLKAFGEVGCLVEPTPPRPPDTCSQSDILIPPPPMPCKLHGRIEGRADADGRPPSGDSGANKDDLKNLVDGKGDVDEGVGKENEEDEWSEGKVAGSKRIKRRRRRNKNKHDERMAIEIGTLGLKVMLKREWKALRNHYLDMQRLNHHRMKEALKNVEIPRGDADTKTDISCVEVVAAPTTANEEVTVSPNDVSDVSTPSTLKVESQDVENSPEGTSHLSKKPEKRKTPTDPNSGDQQPRRKRARLEKMSSSWDHHVPRDERLEMEALRKMPFTPDVILKISCDLSEENSMETIKSKIRTIVKPENIHVRPDSDVIYVRCGDKMAAQTLLKHFSNSVILSGDEQAAYWQHIWDSFKRKRTRRRGKEKLRDRVVKFMGLSGYATAFGSQLEDSRDGAISSRYSPNGDEPQIELSDM